MVQIPRAPVSTAQLTTQPTAPRVADISSFTQTSQAIARAGAVLNSVAGEFRELENLRQSSKGLIEGGRRLTEAEDAILADPELTEKSVDVYQQQKTQIINDILSGVGDERTRLRLQVQLEGSALTKGFNIKRQGREADIVNFEVEKIQVIDQALQDSFKAGANERVLIRANLTTYLNDSLKLSDVKTIATEIATFDEALRKGRASFWLEALTAAQEGRTEADRVAGAQLFLKQIEEGVEYPELTLDEEEALSTDAENFIKRGEFRVKAELEAQQEINQQEDMEDLIDFKISKPQIRKKALSGEWSDSFVKKAIAYLDSTAEIKTTPAAFNETFDMIDGIIKKEDGTTFSRKELTEIMLDRAVVDLGLAEFKTLKSRLAKRLSPQDARRIEFTVKNLRAWARQKIAPSRTIESLTELERSQVDQIEAHFKGRILNEEVIGIKIEDVFEETKSLFSNVSPKVTVDAVLNAEIGQTVTTKFGQEYKKTGRNKWELQEGTSP